MIKQPLEIFVNDTVAQAHICRRDVHNLQRAVLPNGIENRDEADVLIALDRAIHDKDEAWPAFLTQALVDFVVWSARPTGHVDGETAGWLIRSLSCGTGPTELALNVAFEVVRETERCDEALVAFVLRWGGARSFALAAEHRAELVF